MAVDAVMILGSEAQEEEDMARLISRTLLGGTPSDEDSRTYCVLCTRYCEKHLLMKCPPDHCPLRV
jgi:hypothetical protein